MDIKKVTGVYFSPAGSTKTVVETTVDELARLFKAECRYISLNTPSDRAQEYQFAPDELVVFGCPVYAGRLPNKISPDFARCLHGEGTPAVVLVTYGGRAYDNALAEMCELLTKNNFKPVAGGAFLCRHVFSDKLAAGRPDAADLSELRMLAQGVAPGTICIGSPFYCTAMRLREKPESVQAALGAPVEPERPTWDTLAQEDLLELLQTPGWHSAYDARAGGAYLVYDGPDNPFDRWFLSVETARSLGQKLDLIRNAELAGIIVWEASLDTKNHSFAAQLRDTLLR